MRMFAHFAQDEGMAKAIDDDIHLYVATKIYRKPKEEVTKEQRKRAKSTGFGVVYGSGPGTQAETLTKNGLPTTKLEASIVVAGFHREFPSVRRLTNDYKVQLMRQGYIENPFGRRYYIPTKFGYKALNYMCQGTPADLIKRAMVKVWLWLVENGYWPRVKLIMQIHDELVIECPPSLAPTVIPQVMTMMQDKTTYFVPITCEAEVVTKRWSVKKDPADLGLLVGVGSYNESDSCPALPCPGCVNASPLHGVMPCSGFFIFPHFLHDTYKLAKPFIVHLFNFHFATQGDTHSRDPLNV